MPHNIIINPYKELEACHKIGLECYFTVELIHARTGLVKYYTRFKNLITDVGMNSIGSGTTIGTLLTHLGVGTGNTAPAVTDTTLQTEIFRTSSNGGFADVFASGPSFDYWSGTRTRVFTEAQANGNLTELGWFNVGAGGLMFNRQLIKDIGGTPIVIPKTSEDQLKVTFEWRVYMDKSADAQVLDISGVSTTMSHRAYNVDGAEAWGLDLLTLFGGWTPLAIAWENDAMPSDTALQTGSSNSNFTSVVQAYGSGNFYRDVQLKWDLAQANFASGVGSIVSCVHGSSNLSQNFITTFSPKIAKVSTTKLIIMNRYSWARH